MWWWFVLWVIVIFLLLSSGGWYGYRRSYYGTGEAVGLVFVLFIIFWIAIIFAGPYWGWYRWWW